MADVCLCQFTSTGHCGIIQGDKIDNDTSLEILAKIAISQAKAGVDTVVTICNDGWSRLLQ